MAKVHVAQPERFKYETDLAVRITDLNYGKHLSNDNLLAFLHEARMRFLQHYGMHESNVGGTSLIMVDAAIIYRAEAFAGDVLRIFVAVADPGYARIDLVYRVVRRGDDVVIALAKTGCVFLDPETRRVVRAPDELAKLAIPLLP